MNVNYFKSVFKPSDVFSKSLTEIIQDIRNGLVADAVRSIRLITNEDDDPVKKALKVRLPAFQPALANDQTTGIVYFDIDKKDNPELDFDVLKVSIESIAECIFSFVSPSGGLKFGIQTNFKRSTTDKKQVTQIYKKVVHKVTTEHVKSLVGLNFKIDDNSTTLYLPCFLSHDTTAFLNLNCDKLKIEYQDFKIAPVQLPQTYDDDPAFIEQLLSFVPKSYRYAERMPINYSVMNCLGANGISLLLNHWAKSEKEQLEQQLIDQFKNLGFGSIGLLINIARDNGYTEKTGRSRKNIKPKKTTKVLPKLLDAAKGTKLLTEITSAFFQNDRNVFINVSTGAGKSVSVLNILAKEIPNDKKILILVPNHQLADELVVKFASARQSAIKDLNLPQSKGTVLEQLKNTGVNARVIAEKSDLVHLRGQHDLCQFKEAKRAFQGRNIPSKVCSEECPTNEGCEYLEQFNHFAQNIRVMTHNEWTNRQSTWFSGSTIKGDFIFPVSGRTWTPDFIIIDENIFTVAVDKKSSDSGNKYNSIREIIQSVNSGSSLVDAVANWVEEVQQDGTANTVYGYPTFEGNLSTYLEKIKEYEQKLKESSVVLERLYQYTLTGNADHLLGLWVHNNTMHYAPVTQVAERYKKIPTLFLDATANEEIIKKLVPECDFHRIDIAFKQDINLFQLSNSTVTNREVNSSEGRTKLVIWLKKLLDNKGYSKIGLITYKNASGITGDFDNFLADEIGADEYGHFGAIKGLDRFANVDCLLIVGRRFISEAATQTSSAAIFGRLAGHTAAIFRRFAKQTAAFADKLVRMKDGTAYSINCKVFMDEDQQSVHQHYSIAETKQAIGRARNIHGKAKDIYLFTNESMGLDIEVTDFFSRNDDPEEICTEAILSAIRTVGYVANSPKGLTSIGFKANDAKNHRAQIVTELETSGIKLRSCNLKDKNNRRSVSEYFIFEGYELAAGISIDSKIFISFVT